MADVFTPAERAAILSRLNPYAGLACVAGRGERARVVDAHASRRAASVRATGGRRG